MADKKDNKDVKTASDFLNSLTEFYMGFEDLSQSELEEELKEEGIDPDKLLSKVNTLVKSKIKESKMAWRKEALKKRESLLEKISKVQFTTPKMDELKEILLGKHSGIDNALVFGRNMEEFTEEDLKSLYEELKVLEHLKNQEKKDKK